MSAKELVAEVLQSLPEPFGRDVIDDVLCAIEASELWRAQFDGLAERYRDGRPGAPKVIARTVSGQLHLAERHEKRCPSRSGLAETYTRMRAR